jgi:hypothetical protein
MKERNIQDYLYANPEVLFPAGTITEKAREYSIQGKRIDLLFVVDGVRYIVEIKNSPIQREHIGQIVEYYGLMKNYMKDANLAMVLVSSSIPPWRATYLEELGIRCVEIPSVPTTEEHKIIQRDARAYGKKAKQKAEAESVRLNEGRVTFEDIAPPASLNGIAIAQRMLRDTLEPISKSFKEYDVVPFRITSPSSLHFAVEYDPANGTAEFTRGGIWWAYRFGFSEDLPPNDVPNISIIANRTGLEVILNAELQPSQKAMLERIQKFTTIFDSLLRDHGALALQTFLKLEHQPRFYHWILTDFKAPGEFDGEVILRLYHEHENTFWEERDRWTRYIRAKNKKLTGPMIHHLETHNKRLNLAIRLVEPFQKSATFWSRPYEQQVIEIIGAVQRMKPLVDFFIR